MSLAFDLVADEYDATFTNTKIGKAQRQIVRAYLEKILSEKENLNILELNCGTGEDAVWFAGKGHFVTATDISEKMLRLTEKKAKEHNVTDKLTTLKLDLTRVEDFRSDKTFDLIFSNFGGINCITLQNLLKLTDSFGRLLKSSGRLIMIIMPTLCLWEIVYFILKLNLKQAFRRSSTKPVRVKLNGGEILTEYFSPVLINRIFREDFNRADLRPVGFFIPPSYLENFFSSKHKTFNLINKIESFVTKWSALANFSDHYLIDFVKK